MRNCEQCKHYKVQNTPYGKTHGCELWECNFEQKEDKEDKKDELD